MRQNDVLTLLKDSTRAGIYHLPSSARTVVKAAARSAGFACFQVSLADADRIDEVFVRLAQDLAFPEWYGQNFDALKDCLSDFSWCEAAGYVLMISGAGALQAADPAAFHALNAVFVAAIAEWQARKLPLWVFYDLRTDGLAPFPTIT